MDSIIGRLAALGVAVVLTACGGGESAGPEASMPPPRAAQVPSAQCSDAGIASGDYRQVAGQCLRATPKIAAALPLPLAATPAPITHNQLMDWAEGQYPQYFPTAGKTSSSFDVYQYRYYPNAGNYIGVTASGGIYVYGNSFSWEAPVYVGQMADYICTVAPQNCAAPGAPTIGTATPGDTTAVISFTAPSSSGGAAITHYTASCRSASLLTGSGTATASPVTVTTLVNGTAYSCNVTATNDFGTGSPSLSLSVTPSASSNGTTTGTTTTTTSTAGVYCGYSASVYNSSASVQKTSTVSITCNSTTRTFTANGLPDHEVGTFPSDANPHGITSQTVTATMTVTPSSNSTSTSAVIVGYAVNGVKFDPGTNAHCTGSGDNVTCTMNGSGTWSIEALGSVTTGTMTFDLGLDSSYAHVQPGGAYHYHGMPEGIVTRLNRGVAMTLVGFSLDGFPIYARYGYSTATDANSVVRVITGSYQLKSVPDSGRPSTTSWPMGTFKEDYQYVNGHGDLDECNGRFGVTPEFPAGIYHYYITDTYPFIQRCWKGTVPSSGGH